MARQLRTHQEGNAIPQAPYQGKIGGKRSGTF
jgi:hypothetical protein